MRGLRQWWWMRLGGVAWAAGPADGLPTPAAERCVPFVAEPSEDGMTTPAGLDYVQVRGALNGVIQHALGCAQPAGRSAVHLTYDLVVGCDGVVASVVATDTGGAPADYVACVAAVIRKADFPAHDLAEGQLVTYPVDVAW